MKFFSKKYSLDIALPSLLAVALYACALFGYIVPQFTESALQKKKEHIKSLTESTYSILTYYDTLVRSGKLTQVKAQEVVKEIVRSLRYGSQNKDYFWINNMEPLMIIHPYRPDLEQRNLANFQDKKGVYLFKEFVRLAEKNKAGYVRYMWQWEDNPEKIVPKLSYIKLFEPWGWIIGTGVYLDDIEQETRLITRKVSFISAAVIIAVLLLNVIVIFHTTILRKKRDDAEKKLKAHLEQLDQLVAQRTNDLTISEERFRDLIDNAHDLIQSVKPDGTFAYVNRAWHETLGYSESEIDELNIFDLIAPEARDHCLSSFGRVMAGEEIGDVEVILMTKTGKKIIMEGNVSCKQVAGEPLFTRGIFRDITQRKKNEEEISRQNKFLHDVIESIPYPFYVIDLSDYSIVLANSLVGNGVSWMASKCHLLTHGSEVPCSAGDGHKCPIKIVQKTKSPVVLEHVHTDHHGNEQYVEVHGYPIFDSNGEVFQMIESSVDITKRKLLEQRMEEESITDELTGLLNRRGFFTFAEKQLKIAKREGRDIFLLYADLDNMKQINDDFGHEQGDKALIDTAEILKETFRESDICARIGGDEFVALMTNDAEKYSRNSVTRRLQQQIDLNNKNTKRKFDLSISSGVALFDHKHPSSLDVIIREADGLMYENKQRKKTIPETFLGGNIPKR